MNVDLLFQKDKYQHKLKYFPYLYGCDNNCEKCFEGYFNGEADKYYEYRKTENEYRRKGKWSSFDRDEAIFKSLRHYMIIECNERLLAISMLNPNQLANFKQITKTIKEKFNKKIYKHWKNSQFASFNRLFYLILSFSKSIDVNENRDYFLNLYVTILCEILNSDTGIISEDITFLFETNHYEEFMKKYQNRTFGEYDIIPKKYLYNLSKNKFSRAKQMTKKYEYSHDILEKICKIYHDAKHVKFKRMIWEKSVEIYNNKHKIVEKIKICDGNKSNDYSDEVKKWAKAASSHYNNIFKKQHILKDKSFLQKG